MVKRMLCLVIGIMFLFGGNGDCGILTGGSYYVAPVSYDDIVFEFNCDSNTSGVAPTLGTGTITIDAGILLNTTDKTEGTGCLDQNNDSHDEFYLANSGNFDNTNSIIGFEWNPQEDPATNDGSICWSDSGYKAPNGFAFFTDGSNHFVINYCGSNNTTGDSTGFIVGNWYYIEIIFSATTMTVKIDGVQVVTTTKGANEYTQTNTKFMSLGGNALDQLIDRIRISNDNTRDLYAIRDTVIS